MTRDSYAVRHGTVPALVSGMDNTKRRILSGGRVCSLCGKDMGQGQAPAAMTLLVKWSKELGILLAAPESRYLDPRCAKVIQERMRATRTPTK